MSDRCKNIDISCVDTGWRLVYSLFFKPDGCLRVFMSDH